MINKKAAFFCALFIFVTFLVFSGPLHSPSWGFYLDLPEGYEYSGGDGRDKFAFEHDDGAKFEVSVYSYTPYASLEEMVKDVQSRLRNSGDMDFFEYQGKKACLIELLIQLPGAGTMSGWALGIELGENTPTMPGARPLLMALAYGPAGRQGLELLHVSALDSLAPEEGDRRYPGPITEYGYPRETRVRAPIFGLDLSAWIYQEDAEAAQALIEREFMLLRRHLNSPDWQEAWARYYRFIYRDSFDRLRDIAFQVERKFNLPPKENRDLAEDVLRWVQSFDYERNLLGSDFLNLVSAATEGVGDCDNRAMLWAIILIQANIPAAIMVSREYSHAMGLAELPGGGARFELGGRRLLVAETTVQVPIGLIGETVSETEHWLGILFE
jgi:hypothetical protein